MAANLAPVFLDDTRVQLQGDPKPQVSKIVVAGGLQPDAVQVVRLRSQSDTEGRPLSLEDVIDRTAQSAAPVYLRVRGIAPRNPANPSNPGGQNPGQNPGQGGGRSGGRFQPQRPTPEPSPIPEPAPTPPLSEPSGGQTPKSPAEEPANPQPESSESEEQQSAPAADRPGQSRRREPGRGRDTPRSGEPATQQEQDSA